MARLTALTSKHPEQESCALVIFISIEYIGMDILQCIGYIGQALVSNTSSGRRQYIGKISVENSQNKAQMETENE